MIEINGISKEEEEGDILARIIKKYVKRYSELSLDHVEGMVTMPRMTTSQRDQSDEELIYNIDNEKLEYLFEGEWHQVKGPFPDISSPKVI